MRFQSTSECWQNLYSSTTESQWVGQPTSLPAREASSSSLQGRKPCSWALAGLFTLSVSPTRGWEMTVCQVSHMQKLQPCTSHEQVLTGAATCVGSGLQRWTLTSTTAVAPLGPANVPPPLPSGTYTLQNAVRALGGAGCGSYISVGQACNAYGINAG